MVIFVTKQFFPFFLLEVTCLVDEIEVSENREALIVLAGTVAGATTTLIAALPIPAEIKIPTAAFIGSISAATLLYWKNKVNKQ